MGTFCVCDLSFRSFVPNFVPDLLPSCPSWTLSPRCPSCKLVVVRPPPWQPPFPHCPHCPQRPKLSACPCRSTSSGANEKSTHSCVVLTVLVIIHAFLLFLFLVESYEGVLFDFSLLSTVFVVVSSFGIASAAIDIFSGKTRVRS